MTEEEEAQRWERLALWAPMVPVAKARARVTRDGGAYTPEATAKAEAELALRWRAAHGERGLALWGHGEPVHAIITVWLPRPRQSGGNRLFPSVRPDVDNYAKLVLDALNGVAYHDDGQVTRLEVRKRYCEGDELPGYQIDLEGEGHGEKRAGAGAGATGAAGRACDATATVGAA